MASLIAYTRGFIAGLRDRSVWFCPYWVNNDDDDGVSPTDPMALRWHSGWSRGRWSRLGIWINGDPRREPLDRETFDPEEPF